MAEALVSDRQGSSVRIGCCRTAGVGFVGEVAGAALAALIRTLKYSERGCVLITITACHRIAELVETGHRCPVQEIAAPLIAAGVIGGEGSRSKPVTSGVVVVTLL